MNARRYIATSSERYEAHVIDNEAPRVALFGSIETAREAATLMNYGDAFPDDFIWLAAS
jgi:hypothetical protein